MKYKYLIIGSIAGIALLAGAFFLKNGKDLMGNIMMFNSKPAVQASSEQPITSDDIKAQDETSTPENTTQAKEEIPSLEGLTDIEFVKYTVKSKDTLWKIVKANIPDYNSYPVGGIQGVVDYIGNKNNLKKDKNDTYIVYAGQIITIPREKKLASKSTVKNTGTVENSSTTVK